MSRQRLLAVGAGIALLVFAGTSLAFRRTSVQNSRVCLWWASRQITYLINDFTDHPAPSVCGMPGSGLFYQPVENSFAAWTQATRAGESQPCTDLDLQYGGSTSSIQTGMDSQNLVVVRRGRCNDTAIVPSSDPCLQPNANPSCADKYNCWDHGSSNIIALTTVTYRPSTGEIVDADIELNGWNGESSGSTGLYFTCQETTTSTCSSNGQASCTAFDVRNTVTHEAGHFLGLAHPCEISTDPKCSEHSEISSDLTMYPTAPVGDVGKRTLESDDIDGICTVYPAGKSTSTCVSGGGGCSQGPGSLVGLLGVLGLLAFRRRQ